MVAQIEDLEDSLAEQKSIGEYLGMIRRNRASILAYTLLLFLLFVLIAVFWKPTYRSSATILIEEQDIPGDLVRSTITSFAAQRIEIITARVMTRPNLMKIIEKYDLYKKQREVKTTEEIVEQMREDTKLETISAEVVDPRSGRPTTAIIAFKLSYDNKSPTAALKVANELTSLYLNENMRSRQEKADEASRFLKEEADRISMVISELEKKLAEFKKAHGKKLPEFREYNFQLIQRLERDISDTDASIRALEDRKFYIEGQLAQLNPSTPLISSTGDRILSPADRLKSLETELLQLESRYRSDHPDIQKMRKEIEALRSTTDGGLSDAERRKELARLNSELEKKMELYQPGHPDILALKKNIAALQAAEARSRATADNRSVFERNPDNPAYITLKAQLESIKHEIAANRRLLREYKAKLNNAEQRMTQSPEIEREYLGLMRDYDNAVQKFREVKNKQMEATISQELERENKGERFSLIEPPAMPEEPIKPNRLAIILLGAIISSGIGVGQAFLRESFSGAVYTATDLSKLLGSLPLTQIPFYENEMELAKKRKVYFLAATGTLCILVVFILIVHFFVSPLDVLWFRIGRKLEYWLA